MGAIANFIKTQEWAKDWYPADANAHGVCEHDQPLSQYCVKCKRFDADWPEHARLGTKGPVEEPEGHL